MVDYLSRNTTNSLKGVMALMVLLCHLHGRVQLFSNSILGTLFTAFGYLAVSGFFFLSGYGLFEQYKTKENYINSFIKNRIFPYYATCCFVIAIYFSRDLIFQKDLNWIEVLKSFLWGSTIVEGGWYLQTQLLLYIAFYLIFKLFKKNQIIWLGIAILTYILVCVLLHFSATWYEAVLCFLLGMVFSKFSGNIKNFLSDKVFSIITFLIAFVVFVLTLFFGNKPFLPFEIRIIVKMISSLLFPVLAVITLTRVKINNPLTKFLGDISLEIYVLHGLFLTMYRNIITNDIIYIIVVIVSVILVSVLISPVFKFINKSAKKLIQNK